MSFRFAHARFTHARFSRAAHTTPRAAPRSSAAAAAAAAAANLRASAAAAAAGRRFASAAAANAARTAAFLRSRSAHTRAPPALAALHCAVPSPAATSVLRATNCAVAVLARELSTQAGGEGDPADAFGAIVEVDSDADFESILVKLPRDGSLTIVDFHAAWCGPCRVLGPVLVRECTAAGVRLIKVDADGAVATAERYKVSALPTVLALRDGVVVERFVGAQPPPVVRNFLLQLLDKKDK